MALPPHSDISHLGSCAENKVQKYKCIHALTQKGGESMN